MYVTYAEKHFDRLCGIMAERFATEFAKTHGRMPTIIEIKEYTDSSSLDEDISEYISHEVSSIELIGIRED